MGLVEKLRFTGGFEVDFPQGFSRQGKVSWWV